MNGRYSAQEVHVKIRNLTQKYMAEKKDIGPSSGCSSKWMHYNSVHKIIGSNAANSNELFETFVFDDTPSESDVYPPQFMALPEFSPPSSSLTSLPSPEAEDSPGPSSSKQRKRGYDKFIYEEMQKQTNLQETQLSVVKDLCSDFGSFLRHTAETDNAFLQIFREMSNK